MKKAEKLNKIYENILEKIKFFINKDNFTKTKLILVAIMSVLIATLCEYTIFRISHPEFISKNRIMLVSIIIMFIGIHFVFKLRKMYEFIHNHRYKIACAFLLFVMIFKYSGSSIVEFNSEIQPHIDNARYHTLLGQTRRIRTDEWATSTTYILSQSKTEVPFQYFSDVLRGTPTDMFTVANSPVLDILMIGRPFQLGFMLFGTDAGLSFYWYARLVAMMLGSYELCLILTKRNKKVSLCGMIVITFSAAVQWWYCMQVLIWGQIVVVLVDKFMTTNKKRNKYLCALGILVSGLSYIFEFYPAWQISFGYVFLALIIWILIKNIKYEKYRFTKHDVAVIVITLLCIALLLGRWYMLSKDTLAAEMNTDYPGERNEVGGGALNLYSYFYNIFFPTEEYLNPCEYSSMLSLFPIPLILGLIYVIRNKKDLHFWIPMLVVGGFLSIWCVYGFPEFLAVLTKMSMSTAGRASIPLGTVCIYILIYLIGNFEKDDKLINKKLSYVLSGIFILFIIYKAKTTIGFAEEFHYLDKFKILLGGEIFLALIFGVLNINNEKIKNYTIYGLIAVALITGLGVNPVIRTTDVLYTKPVAIKMQEIKKENPDAIWAVNDAGWYKNDYAVANGIRTINSTAVYPNFELFEKLLGEKAKEEEIRKIYNRYAHVNFEVTDEESNVELLFADNIAIKVNYKDLQKLNIEYILSTVDLNKNFKDNEDARSTFKEIYNEDKIYIYEVLK